MKQLHIRITHIALLTVVVMAGAGFIYGEYLTPRLEATNIDLGTFVPGQTLERVVKIRNLGWKTLILYDAKACCGTTLPQGFPKQIGPRSSAYIPVRIQTSTKYNSLHRKIALKTNDRTQPVSNILIHGEPDTCITVNPEKVLLEYIVEGGAFSNIAEVKMQNKPEKSAYITTSSHYIKAWLDEDPDVDNVYRVNIEISRNTPRGDLVEYIYIKTGISDRPNITIPITAKVERGLRPRPERIFFGVIDGTIRISRSIRLIVIGPEWESFEVENFEHDGIEAEIEQENLKHFKLNIHIYPLKMRALLDTFVTLRNSSGNEMTIPLFAVHKKYLQDKKS